MPLIADRVQQNTSTTGTGTINLTGTLTGFQSFSTAFATGSQIYYALSDGTNWEVGIGTLTTGSPWTLSRTTVLSSSNAGALVSFPGPSTNVWCDLPAAAVSALGS